MSENVLRKMIKADISLIKENIAEYEQIPVEEIEDSAFIYALAKAHITDYKTISKVELFYENYTRIRNGWNKNDEYRDCDMFINKEDNYCPPLKFIFD